MVFIRTAQVSPLICRSSPVVCFSMISKWWLCHTQEMHYNYIYWTWNFFGIKNNFEWFIWQSKFNANRPINTMKHLTDFGFKRECNKYVHLNIHFAFAQMKNSITYLCGLIPTFDIHVQNERVLNIVHWINCLERTHYNCIINIEWKFSIWSESTTK